MSVNDFTNVSRYGPGFWATIHMLAFNANTKSEQKQFMKTMNIIAHQFPCRNCSNHAKEYIKNHPMEDYVTDDDHLSMFKWTWKFHNAVNNRLRKEIMSYDMALHIYTQFKIADQMGENLVFTNKSKGEVKSVCSKECSEAENFNDKHKEKEKSKSKKKDSQKLYMLDKQITEKKSKHKK